MFLHELNLATQILTCQVDDSYLLSAAEACAGITGHKTILSLCILGF